MKLDNPHVKKLWEYFLEKYRIVLTYEDFRRIDDYKSPLEDAEKGTCKWTKRFEEYSNCLIGYTTGCFAEDCDEHSNYSLLTDYCPECGGKIEVVE